MSRQGGGCAHQEVVLSGLLDGQVDARQAQAAQVHLEACAECRAAYDGLRRTRSLLRSMPVRSVPAGMFNESQLTDGPRMVPRSAVGSDGLADRPRVIGRARHGALVTSLAVALLVTVMAVAAVAGLDPTAAASIDMATLAQAHVDETGASGVPMPALASPAGRQPGARGSAVTVLADAASRGGQVHLVGEAEITEWPDGPDGAPVVHRAVLTRPAMSQTSSSIDPTHKYDIAIGEYDHVMDRPCIRIDLRLADDGDLREQVWIDEQSGVFVRRETFVDGARSRSVSYLSLDLEETADPDRADGAEQSQRPAGPAPVATVGNGAGLDLSLAQIRALRASGWVIPDRLPADYQLIDVTVHPDISGLPVQAVYSDGLYSVSMFVQPGEPDLDAAARQGTTVQELTDRQSYDWPGLMPARILWAGPARAYTLIGDAPRDDMLSLAAALPAVDSGGLLDRFGLAVRSLVGGASRS